MIEVLYGFMFIVLIYNLKQKHMVNSRVMNNKKTRKKTLFLFEFLRGKTLKTTVFNISVRFFTKVHF